MFHRYVESPQGAGVVPALQFEGDRVIDDRNHRSDAFEAFIERGENPCGIGVGNGGEELRPPQKVFRSRPRRATKAFGVLPLPREGAFLRMIDIDPKTGVLVSSYANIVDIVNGPRMALIIEPGDDAYPEKFTAASGVPTVNVAVAP